MQNTLEYIEDYFTQVLSEEERKAFEVRIEQDAAFAQDVAFYLTTRNVLQELLEEKRETAFAQSKDHAPETSIKGEPENTFAEKETTKKGRDKTTPVSKLPLRKWLPYAAAACVIFVIAALFLLRSPEPQQLAREYIKENYSILSLTMDASHDSLQLGIEAYNNQDYQRALSFFEGVRHNDPANSDVKKYAGLAYLQTKNYDKALKCFQELTAMGGSYNSGDILSAITLMQRDGPGDEAKAKQLLHKVVNEKEDGAVQAKDWLDRWK